MTETQTFYTVQEAARFLRFSRTTLNVWRSEGRGPTYVKIGRSVRYRGADLERWAIADSSSRIAIEELSECHKFKRELTKRPRGRAGAANRDRRLSAHPLCQDCLADGGVERAATEIDHIIPLALGGSDEDENVRCLCKPCHARRTKEQFAARIARE